MKIGCDPELFVERNGRIISAHGIIPGTKENPFKVTDGAVQVDGTAVEFNINPAENLQDFKRYIASVMSDLTDLVKENNSSNNLACVSSVEYDKNYFETIPPEARELGCSPDFDAYRLIQRQMPRMARYTTLRTAAGHIHIGWGEHFDPDDEEHWVHNVKSTRVSDALVNRYLEPLEDNLKRRELYGLPGTFRPKSYGTEYRTPSNQWLKFEERISEVYERTMRGIETLIKNDWNLDKTLAEVA